MGPSPSQAKPSAEAEGEPLVINHPRFTNLKVLRLPSEDDEGAIEVIVTLPNETEFKRWEKQVLEVVETENLFLPIGKRFDKTEFCGSGGICTVLSLSRRSASSTTPTFCGTKLLIVAAWRASALKRQNYGTWSSPSSRPHRHSTQQAGSWVTCVL